MKTLNSPLNYTGNKFKLLPQLMPLLNGQAETMVDVFGGSGLVSLNSDCARIVINDNNPVTIELLKYFQTQPASEIIAAMDKIIIEYGFTDSHRKGIKAYPEEKHEGLSRYNRAAFQQLKADYNARPCMEKLFALIIFGFNHYIRFNRKGEYNVPVGKVDYSSSLRQKTMEYAEAFRRKQVTITQRDFRDAKLYRDATALYYFDPPYLITQAPYNAKWSENDDADLLQLLDELNRKGYKFALSNVVSANGKVNQKLQDWSEKYNVHYLNRKYLNSNYRKKNLTIAQEVLVTNYQERTDGDER